MRGAIFHELRPQEQWEGGGEAGGRRPGPGWRWRRPASWARGRGVSPGHWAESRSFLARENRGLRWRGPGRRRGRGPSPPGWDLEGEEGRGGVSFSSPSAFERCGGSGRRWALSPRGEASGGPRAPGGLAGLSPLPSSPPRGDAAPPDARLRQLRRSPSSPRLAAAATRWPARGCLGGQDRRLLLLGGADRGGAEGVDRVKGAGGEGAERRGRERGSDRASRGISVQLERASEPARAAARRTDRGQTAPGSRAAAARLAVSVALLWAARTPRHPSSCVCVCVCVVFLRY